MPLATPTAFPSTTGATIRVLAAQRFERRGASITNGSTGTNTLYITVGSTAVAPSSTSHTVQISPASLYETPPCYQGEVITAAWATTSSAYGFITEWL